MNAIEITNVVPQTEDVESAAIEEFTAPRQPALGAMCNARMRYALFVSIALLLAGLAFIVHNSLDEINAEIEMIDANLRSAWL
jgi:hypothetical protein